MWTNPPWVPLQKGAFPKEKGHVQLVQLVQHVQQLAVLLIFSELILEMSVSVESQIALLLLI